MGRKKTYNAICGKAESGPKSHGSMKTVSVGSLDRINKNDLEAEFEKESVLSRNGSKKLSRPSGGGRASGIELLRVLCMFCIIMSHYLMHGIEVVSDNSPCWSLFVYPLAYIANNVFFLITGWFLLKTKFSFKKLVSLVLHILTVNYLILLVNLVVFGERSLANIVKQIFPITSNLNWFLSIYVFIYAIGPFLKCMVIFLRARRKMYNALVVVLLFFYSILGFITPLNVYASTLMQGVVIVLLGSWLELYKEKVRTFHPAILAISGYALVILFTLCLMIAARFIPALSDLCAHFCSNNCPFIILSAVGLLLCFSNLNFHSKAVNLVASSVMTTYLIHDNGQFSNHVWLDIMKVQNHLSAICPYMFICALVILGGCFVIDQIIKHTVQPLILRVLNKPIGYMSRRLDELGIPY